MKNSFCMNAGNLMTKVMQITSDQFIDPPKNSGIFEVLDERMNDFEKAVYTVMSRTQVSITELEEKRECAKLPSGKKTSLAREAKELEDQFQMLKGILYFSIQDRLNRWGCRLGVSKGFKIVIPEEEVAIIRISVPSEFHKVFKKLASQSSFADEVIPKGATLH